MFMPLLDRPNLTIGDSGQQSIPAPDNETKEVADNRHPFLLHKASWVN
jgi:hypothetical protein